MKRYVSDFIHRGIIACGIGPLILAVVYLIIRHYTDMQTLSVNQVVIGILSLEALAFIAGGVNVVYRIERLPLSVAITIHGIVLYFGYLVTYLLNDWMKKDKISFLVFTGIFVIGYVVIWAVIYLVINSKIKKINKSLKEKQQTVANS